ncbi:hypothetical protein BGX27_003493 [Mortierella sp. AM989]|nr:hypothetical protein BGX27_003493 [Mortierella sp. AM989]
MTNIGQSPTDPFLNEVDEQRLQLTSATMVIPAESNIATSNIILDPNISIRVIPASTSTINAISGYVSLSNVQMHAQTMAHATFFPLQQHFQQEIATPHIFQNTGMEIPGIGCTDMNLSSDIEMACDKIYREYMRDNADFITCFQDSCTINPTLGEQVPATVYLNQLSGTSNERLSHQHRQYQIEHQVSSHSSKAALMDHQFHQGTDMSGSSNFGQPNTTTVPLTHTPMEYPSLAAICEPYGQHLQLQQQLQVPLVCPSVPFGGYLPTLIASSSTSTSLSSSVHSASIPAMTSGGFDSLELLLRNHNQANPNSSCGDISTPEFLSTMSQSKDEPGTPSTGGPITPMLILANNPQFGCMSEADTTHLLLQLQAVEEKEYGLFQAAQKPGQEQRHLQSTDGGQSQRVQLTPNREDALIQDEHDREQLLQQLDQQVTEQQERVRLMMEQEIKRENAEEEELLRLINGSNITDGEDNPNPYGGNSRENSHDGNVSDFSGYSADSASLSDSFLQSALLNASAIVDSGAARESVNHVQAQGSMSSLLTRGHLRQQLEQHRRYLGRSRNQSQSSNRSEVRSAIPSPSRYAGSSTAGSDVCNGYSSIQEYAVQEIDQAQSLLEQLQSDRVSVAMSPLVHAIDQFESYHPFDDSPEVDQQHEFLLLQRPLPQQNLDLVNDYDTESSNNDVQGEQYQLSTASDMLATQQADLIQSQQQQLEELQRQLQELKQQQEQRYRISTTNAVQAPQKDQVQDELVLATLSSLVHRRGRQPRPHPYSIQGCKTPPLSSSIASHNPQAQDHNKNQSVVLNHDCLGTTPLNDDLKNHQDPVAFQSTSHDFTVAGSTIASVLSNQAALKHVIENNAFSIACNFPGCTRSFASLGLLKSHLVSHQADKPYWCDICSYDGVAPRPITEGSGNPVLRRSSSSRPSLRTGTNSTDQPQIAYYEVKRYKRNHDLLRHKREQHPPIEVKLQREAERLAARAAKKLKNEAQKKSKTTVRSRGKRNKAAASSPAVTTRATTTEANTTQSLSDSSLDLRLESSHQNPQYQQHQYESSIYSDTNMAPGEVRTGYPPQHQQTQFQVQNAHQSVDLYCLDFINNANMQQRQFLAPSDSSPAAFPGTSTVGKFRNVDHMGPAAHSRPSVYQDAVASMGLTPEGSSSDEYAASDNGVITNDCGLFSDSDTEEGMMCEISESESGSTDDEDDYGNHLRELNQMQHQGLQCENARFSCAVTMSRQLSLSSGSSSGSGGNESSGSTGSHIGRRRKYSSPDRTDGDDEYCPPGSLRGKGAHRGKTPRHR